MSGTLHHLGLSVPGPFLGANDSNPKGFFESRWSVRFHKELLRAAGVDEFDSRPGAFDLVARAVTPERRQQVVDFLREKGGDAEQVVVKDPRTVWTQQVWRDAATEVGRDIRYVSMLRHPAEVVGSRTTYYASEEVDQRRRYEIFNVARWINSTLICERETRGQRRVFVRYVDLLEDWRTVMTRVGATLDLHYDPPITEAPHAVDDFIDAGLRRHTVTWDELATPRDLKRIAQEVWDCHQTLVDGEDAATSARLDELAEEFRLVLFDAVAISHDVVIQARRETRLKVEEELRAEGDSAPAQQFETIEQRPVSDVAARDLARIAARRVLGRLRRS